MPRFYQLKPTSIQGALHWHCSAWEKLQEAPRRRWLATDNDPFRTIPVENIDICARPDFGYDGSPETIQSVLDGIASNLRANQSFQSIQKIVIAQKLTSPDPAFA